MDYKTIRTHINFKVLAKMFFDLADERYPTAEKVKHYAAKIVDPMTKDLYESVHFKIAVISVMRNMIKEVSPQHLYRSVQHRDDLYNAIIQALEDLEDVLEDIYEKMALEEDEE